jgi:ABC-type branched-subunit amino acid transport system substrate-binding protein
MRGRIVVTGVLLAALAVSACGSGTSTAKPKATTPGSTTPTDTKLGDGVTGDSIKLGIALVNFDCIKQYTDSIRVGQQAVYQAFINDINEKGGIAGRKIVPVYKMYCPPPLSQVLLTYCTSFAQDDHVFAVLGTFVDFSGDAQTCIANQQHRVLLTFNLTQAIMDKSPPGLIVTPGSVPERGAAILIGLVGKAGTLKGKTVAILGDTNETSVVKNTIEPGLKKLGLKLGSTALLTFASGGDTTQSQAQLDSFIEKWKTQGVNAIFMSGNLASTKQFVEKIKARMPDVLLLSDNTDTLMQAQQETITPNPYQGLLTPGGLSPKESDESANWKFCADIYQKQTGKHAEGAQEIIRSMDAKHPSKTGKYILDEHGTISDACQLLWFFHDIAAKTGKYLNNNNWVNAVNTYGEIVNRGTGRYSSIHSGKYSAEDNWRLQKFDSAVKPNGNWVPISPLQNINS